MSLNSSLKLWAEVKANLEKLRACERHLFIVEGVPRLGQRVVCSKCAGHMQLTDVGTYIAGYKAAGGDVNDIWPGYEVKA